MYLQGAYELRNGVPTAGGTQVASPDTIRAMPPDMLFDYLGVRLNGPKAAGKNPTLNVDFTDLQKQYGLTVENAVLNYTTTPLPKADANLALMKGTFDQIYLGQTTIDDAIKSGDLRVEGNQQTLPDFMGLLDTYNFWFNIVTP